MIFDVLKFLVDYKIPFSDTGKNAAPGWMQIQCPFCDDSSDHGGWNLSSGKYNCWKCGSHSLLALIKKLVGCNRAEGYRIIFQYRSRGVTTDRGKPIHIPAKFVTLPGGKLGTMHKKYLLQRNFDPDELEYHWNLTGTGFLGDYRFRIIAPIIVDGNLVSYQGRDVTNESSERYKACRQQDEVIIHKHIVYGIDYVQNRQAVIVEGITDVWRLGRGAIATFGTSYKIEQINFMANRLDRAVICYDKEAEDNADRLANSLSGLGVDVSILEIDADDPAELSNKEAKEIMTAFEKGEI